MYSEMGMNELKRIVKVMNDRPLLWAISTVSVARYQWSTVRRISTEKPIAHTAARKI